MISRWRNTPRRAFGPPVATTRMLYRRGGSMLEMLANSRRFSARCHLLFPLLLPLFASVLAVSYMRDPSFYRRLSIIGGRGDPERNTEEQDVMHACGMQHSAITADESVQRRMLIKDQVAVRIHMLTRFPNIFTEVVPTIEITTATETFVQTLRKYVKQIAPTSSMKKTRLPGFFMQIAKQVWWQQQTAHQSTTIPHIHAHHHHHRHHHHQHHALPSSTSGFSAITSNKIMHDDMYFSSRH